LYIFHATIYIHNIQHHLAEQCFYLLIIIATRFDLSSWPSSGNS